MFIVLGGLLMTDLSISPIQPAERISEIDIIRGLALFGILMVNMSFFKFPVFFDRYPSSFAAGGDQIGAWIIQLLFTGKFYAIFSFLFGLGFYIFMERTLQKGFNLVPLYRRRLLALLLFGLIHLLFFWSGDILFTYALVGFILLGFRDKPLESIKKWIIGLFAASLVMHVLFGLISGYNELMLGDQYGAMMASMIAETKVYYLQGSFFELAAYRAVNEMPYVLLSLFLVIPAVLAFFLCGLYVGRVGIFKDLPAHAPLFRKIRNLGLPLGALLLAVYVLVEKGLWPVGMLFRPVLLSAVNYSASLFIFPAYVALLLLALQKDGAKKILSPIAAAGRMALTNYLSHTLISVLLFNGFGFGLYSSISVLQGIVIVLVIYAAQIILSNLWLGRFRYGPLEWLWRVMTYKQIQPFLVRRVS
jgi:uncharacterized protein